MTYRKIAIISPGLVFDKKAFFGGLLSVILAIERNFAFFKNV